MTQSDTRFRRIGWVGVAVGILGLGIAAGVVLTTARQQSHTLITPTDPCGWLTRDNAAEAIGVPVDAGVSLKNIGPGPPKCSYSASNQPCAPYCVAAVSYVDITVLPSRQVFERTRTSAAIPLDGIGSEAFYICAEDFGDTCRLSVRVEDSSGSAFFWLEVVNVSNAKQLDALKSEEKIAAQLVLRNLGV